MTNRLNRRRRQLGAATALLTMAVPIFLIPLMGLAIDGSMLFIIHARLSQAADGAALGAGRLLGTPANSDEIAGEFLRANFPAGWWGTRNLTPTIATTRALGTYTINVNATVEAPLLFLRIFGGRWSTITASAVSTRRDTRVVMVLDRSGSMSGTDPVSGLNVFATLQTSARNFVGMFTPGTDELGLVAYSGSAIVAYPTARPWNPSPASAGGPDTGFGTSATTGVMIDQINLMRAAGGTNISEALWLAHIELQKAHNRALAATGLDNSLNAIVLFTDGVPSAFSVSPNDNSDLPNSNSLKSTSPCTYNPANNNASSKMRGWIAVPGSTPPVWGTPSGLYRLSSFDTSQTLTFYLQNGTYDQRVSDPSTAVGNCSGLGSSFSLNELRQIPPIDYWGNSTSGTGYQSSSVVYNGTIYNPTTLPISGYQAALAAWNASDNAGKRIRTQTAMNPVVIYCIGYTGNSGGTDIALLKRLANTLDSSSYQAGEQSGLLFVVNTADQLTGAFNAVASDLLRLAR